MMMMLSRQRSPFLFCRNRRMRSSILTCTSLLLSTDQGMHFRGGPKEDGTADAVLGERRNLRTNAVVEAFFSNSSVDDGASSEALTTEIHRLASNETDFLTQTRRTLHKIPELMYNEKQTSQVIQAALSEWEIPFTKGWAVNKNPHIHTAGPGGFGVVADIGTGQKPCVLLRADMDALPITERTEVEFASRHDRTMHACGHDGHTAMLLGAVAVLKNMEDSLQGTIRCVWQPAEEGGAGGKRMREEGVLELDPKPSYAFGMHVWPALPTGTIASRPGPIMAAAERFEVLVSGVGGHAGMPHLTVDPVVCAASIVVNAQAIVSRTVNPLEAGVVSVTQIDTGTGAFNVIPESAVIKGTIRALSTDTLLALQERLERMVESTAVAHGCGVTVTVSPDYYPVTINDPALYEEFAAGVAALVSDEGRVREVEPSMGAEDFSFLAETIPSVFFFLGQGSGQNPPTNHGLHHPHFALDETVLPRGVELHVNLALRALRKLRKEEMGMKESVSTTS